MVGGRAGRRGRGFARDVANQLAQMAVGIEAMFVGSSLANEPSVGIIEVDAVTRSASVNGRLVKRALADYLTDWVIAEVNRKKLDRTWLKSATVRIEYSQAPRKGGRTCLGEFVASALVVSNLGEATATFANKQLLVRKRAPDS
jgi:hypothetical protein